MKKSKAFSKRTFGWDLFVTSQVNFGPELLSTSKAVPFESKVSAGLNIRFFEIPIYNKGPIYAVKGKGFSSNIECRFLKYSGFNNNNQFLSKNLHKTRGKKTKSILKRIDHKSAFTITALSSWRTICSGSYKLRISWYRYFCTEDMIKAASKINAVRKQWNSVTENNVTIESPRNVCRRHRSDDKNPIRKAHD